MAEFRVITQGECNEAYVDGKEALRRRLMPFFGGRAVNEISAGLIQEYRIHPLNPPVNRPTKAGAKGAAKTRRRSPMAVIGTFHKDQNGNYAGAIKTLTLDVKSAQMRAADKDNDKAPDFRLFSGQTEFGAAWKKTSREHREYLSVKLDDPSFPAAIYASLVEADNGYALIWSRNRIAD